MSIHANKVVLVTGASSGVGAAAARKFAAEGAKVAMVGRNQVKLKNVAEQCAERGAKPLVIAADISDENQVKDIVQNTVDKFGKLDILVNNAATPGSKVSILDDCMATYDKLISTNLRGAIRLTNLAARYLVETKGNIVNISSIASVKPMSINFPYSVSKAGLDQFTRCIAYELGSKGVRVNCLLLGPVKTDIFENLGKGEMQDHIFESLRKGTALERVSEPEDAAEFISFLASDRAAGVTGSLIVADDGFMVKGSFK